MNFDFGLRWSLLVQVDFPSAQGIISCQGSRGIVLEFCFPFSSDVIGFQRVRVSIGGTGGFPLRAGSVGVWFVGCLSSRNLSFDFSQRV